MLLGTFCLQNNLDDYDPSGEGSLFKAPESIMEESELQLDPMAEAISMMSNGGDLTTEDPLLSDVYYECQKDILANSASGQPFSELSNLQIPILDMEMKEYEANREKSDINVDQIQRSVGSTCQKPTSPCNFKGKYLRPNFLDFEQMGLADALGIRKAHSQEDIKVKFTLTHFSYCVLRKYKRNSEKILVSISLTTERRTEAWYWIFGK